MSILVIGDQPELMKQLGELRETIGQADVFTTTSLNATLEQFGTIEEEEAASPRGAVEIIIIDHKLDTMSIGDACRGLINVAPDIPILLVTDPTRSQMIEEALLAGAADFISRPIRVMDLRARVHCALRLKREIDTRKERDEELAEANRRLHNVSQALHRISSLDHVTEVANRDHLEMELLREWRRVTRSKLPLSLIMADLDFFKVFNDSYGHEAGDDCLKRVAAALSQAVNRAGDIVGRYGGEEFLIILPETPLSGAAGMAETLRAAIESIGIVHAFSAINDRITISLGVASQVPTREGKPLSLVHSAERALYRAKHDGRNRVRVADMP